MALHEKGNGEVSVNNKKRYKHMKKMYGRWFKEWFMREMVRRVQERMDNAILYGTEKTERKN